jgi:hypothetical protein
MNVHAPVFPALEFTISLTSDGSYLVREEHGRGGAQFADLSDAILFVQDECRAQKYRPTLHFDRSLACIRAAG